MSHRRLGTLAILMATAWAWGMATWAAEPATRTRNQKLDNENAEYHAVLGVSLDGSRVIAILPGSPAAKAGLQVGDEIQTVDNRAVRSPQAFREQIGKLRGGALVELEIVRQEARQTVWATIAPDGSTFGAHKAKRPLPAITPDRRQSNYRPAENEIDRERMRAAEARRALRDEDRQNAGLDKARRDVDPNSDIVVRSRQAERRLDRAQRAFDRDTNRLADKAGSADEYDDERTAEPPGYHVVGPGDVSGPRINRVERGPAQYYGRPGASQSERGDYPLIGDKGGISRDRRQAVASDAFSPDRGGRTSAEDRSTRLVEEFSTHVDRQNGRPDRSGENDSRIRTQRPYTRPVAPGRPWQPDSSGGGTAYPSAWDGDANPPNEGTYLRNPREANSGLNREIKPRPRAARDDD